MGWLMLGFLGTVALVGVCWALCAAASRGDEMAARAEEAAKFDQWRASRGHDLPKAQVAPRYGIVVRGRDDGRPW